MTQEKAYDETSECLCVFDNERTPNPIIVVYWNDVTSLSTMLSGMYIADIC